MIIFGFIVVCLINLDLKNPQILGLLGVSLGLFMLMHLRVLNLEFLRFKENNPENLNKITRYFNSNGKGKN